MATHATVRAPARSTQNFDNPSKPAIAICGGFGAIVAILADIYLKDTACAVDALDQKLRAILQIHLHPLGVMAMLIVIGIGLCFVFPEPSTGKAFFRGASVLTMVMTATPYEAPPNIPRAADEPQPTVSVLHIDSLLVPVVLAAGPSQETQFRLDIHLVAQDGKKISGAIYSLTDPTTGAVLARSRIAGSDASFYLAKRDYALRVEVTNYKIATVPVQLQHAQSLTVPLQPSWMPLAFQRVIM